MISKRKRYLLILPAALLVVGTIYVVATTRGVAPSAALCDDVNRPPEIRPAYQDCMIPPNFAPLHFIIAEPGSRYFVKIHAEQGQPIEILSRTPVIRIPAGKWRDLLALNRGRPLSLEVLVEDDATPTKTEGGGRRWKRFETLRNRIAQEDIDRFLVYRKIHPAHSAWRDIGIYQRDLSGFDESCVLSNDSFQQGCLNCHTFCNNRTDTMLISTRSPRYGSAAIVINDDVADKVGTKFGYTAWHPSGKLVTFANTAVALFLHPAAGEIRDVIDLDAFLACYHLDEKVIKTAPPLARKDRLETYPTWSPDGRYLYFCSAPLTWERRDAVPENYRDIKYDLVRVAYDIERDQWGELETVLPAQETGRSILLPRISPDGRWLLFCMCDYGCFPIYQESSDLHLMDLQTLSISNLGFPTSDSTREANPQSAISNPQYARLACNSPQSESWHSWSSNSRWIAFSSKRDYGVFTRIYLSHVDPNGVVSKPLLLPQKNPTFYDSCLNTYSVPELVTEPVRVTGERLARVARSRDAISAPMPITAATPKAAPPTQTEYHILTRE